MVTAHVTFNYTWSFIIFAGEGKAEVSENVWTYGDDIKPPTVSSSTNDTTPTVEYIECVDYPDDEIYKSDSLYGWTEEMPTEAGEYKVRVTYPATAGYKEIVTIADFIINPKELTASVEAESKTYDGDNGADIKADSITLNGIVGNDDVYLDGTLYRAYGQFESANVGTWKVTASLQGLKLAGDDADNYTLNETGIGEATIMPIEVKIIGTLVSGKYYDGNTTAQITDIGKLKCVSTRDSIRGADKENLQIEAGKATFASKDVRKDGKSITVSFSDFKLTGSAAGNYKLVSQPEDRIAWIIPKELTVTVNAKDKEYDGTANADVNPQISGVVEGDTVNLNTDNMEAVFSDETVGEGKIVTVTGLTIDNDNYILPSNITDEADITECLHASAKDDGDCTTAVVCPVCKKTITAAKNNHKWDNWESNGDGTHTGKCTAEGCSKTITENCYGGTATCKGKECRVCEELYGDTDMSNHTGAEEWVKTATTHLKKWNCCGTVTVKEENHHWKDGKCTECEYQCQHPDAKDDGNCTTAIVCPICKETVKEANDAHTWSLWQSKGDGTHSRGCGISGCTIQETENCFGGTATCKEKAKCKGCDAEYGDYSHSGEKWEITETTHEKVCTNCGATIVKCEDHHWVDGKCTECEYVCKHTNLQKTEAKDASVTECGNIEYWYCDECKKYFSDEDGTKVINLKDTVIAKLAPVIIDEEEKSVIEGEKNLPVGEHKLSIVSEDTTAKAKFNVNENTTAKAKFTVNEKPAESGTGKNTDRTIPQTDDDSDVSLWLTLLFISGGAVTAMAVGRKKSRAK